MPEGIVQTQVKDAIHHALSMAKEQGQLTASSLPSPTLELPKREEWGDFACNVAMAMAKVEHRSPVEIASLLAEHLKEARTVIEHVEVANPGFLNLTLVPSVWFAVLYDIEEKGKDYGRSEMGHGQRVLLEYVSANPTGPLHLGHGRGAALGDALSRMLQAVGYEVEREYYINDAGRQIKLLAASVFARYQELQGRCVTFPEDGYHGHYIQTVAKHIADQFGASLLDISASEAEERCGRLAYEELLTSIREDLRSFRVEFDSWFSEAELYASGKVQQALATLRERELAFEQEGALWFRSSQFQDDKDRVVCKQDGDYTYLASDIAYHQDKLKRGFDRLLNVWGADHHGYVSRMQGAVQAFGYPKDRLQMVLVQMVSLLRDGKKVEMSKRSGEFVTLQEVVKEVGVDAARFFFLMRRADSHLEFDVELAKRQSTENPVYYVQYAHARLSSLFRTAQARGVVMCTGRDVTLTALTQPEELRLIKHLSQFPDLVESCARFLEPHRLPFYLQELAGNLHVFYYKHRVLPLDKEDEVAGQPSIVGAKAYSAKSREVFSFEVMQARLFLLQQVQTVLRNGLELLGIRAPEQM
ncbi:MAG: arginine--tRNA ligase [Nitrospirales bacterium]|nr:arginine--tRNA ligase [Nitrospirales bacterium]